MKKFDSSIKSMETKSGKIDRILNIYDKLINGGIINKSKEALNHEVNERSIQRDIEDIRNHLASHDNNTGYMNEVIYDRAKKGYRLEQLYQLKLTNSEILATCKILLDSRAFPKKEIEEIIKKLIDCCIPKENQDLVNDMIKNELFHYIPPKHNKNFMETMWLISQAIHTKNYVEIEYTKLPNETRTRKLIPTAILFSEFYFYMLGFITDKEVTKRFKIQNDTLPNIYRLDRIKKINILNEKFHISYDKRFSEGEFRKRVQFMYGGKLRKVTFKYTGLNINAVLDRLPSAKEKKEADGSYTVTVDVYGDGIDMWLRSQGSYVEVIEDGK